MSDVRWWYTTFILLGNEKRTLTPKPFRKSQWSQTRVESSRLLAVIVPLKPLLRSRVAWGSTMWDWPRMEARLYSSFVDVELRIVPFPFVITVFSWGSHI